MGDGTAPASRPAHGLNAAALQRPAAPPREAPTWELVLKRNSIERLKREKFPLDIRDELPRLIDEGYEQVSEEDIVRLQWWGLYHDKPKVGYFMLRIKLPNGILSPQQVRTIGELCIKYGRGDEEQSLRSGTGYCELATRQNIQLHWIRLVHLPDVFATLERNGLTTAGGCGDTVRNITGCPVAGVSRDELFDTTPLVLEAARFFYGNREYSDLPRKHKITIAACPYQCNAPEMHCIALIGAKKIEVDGRERLGYAVRVGGGLSSAPRIARDLNAFVEPGDAIPVLRAILDLWKSDPKYRLSRVKARLKFMVDDYGAEGFRQQVVERLGRPLEEFPAPTPAAQTEHIGVHPQRQEGFYYIGFPVYLGIVTGEQLRRIADVVEDYDGDVRVTRQQNLILTGVPETRVEEVVTRMGELGIPLDANRIRATSVGCTGQPLCNYAVTPTKGKLGQLIQHLERTFGSTIEGLKINLDGCPHACGHHWLGDIGLQGTTGRGDATSDEKIEAYDIFLRGRYGADAQIGRPLIRRVPEADTQFYVERLVRAYLEGRQDTESFQQWSDRLTDEELVAIGMGGARQARGDGDAPTLAASDARPLRQVQVATGVRPAARHTLSPVVLETGIGG